MFIASESSVCHASLDDKNPFNARPWDEGMCRDGHDGHNLKHGARPCEPRACQPVVRTVESGVKSDAPSSKRAVAQRIEIRC